MSEFRVNSITNQDGSAGPQVCGVSTFSGKSGVQIPSGSSDFRRQDGGGRGRGVFAGGQNPSQTSTCEKIEIATTGNATDFGDLSEASSTFDGCSSSTRGVVMGGNVSASPYASDKIEYFTMASDGGSNDFGALTRTLRYAGSANSSTRGLAAGSYSPTKTNIIDFVTIATTGDASDFGDLIAARQIDTGTSSPTRAVFAAGEGSAPGHPESNPASPYAENIIEFVTIATKGNAQNFGDLSSNLWGVGTTGNSTKGLFFGGRNPTQTDTIESITIATEGNPVDFGNLLAATGYANGVSSKTRGVIGGGEVPSAQNVLQFVTISTAGNTTDFGDLATTRARGAAFSDSNGGLTQ